MRIRTLLTLAIAIAPIGTFAQVPSARGSNELMMQTLNEHAVIERDIAYAQNSNPKQRLDIYMPKRRTAEPLPVVIFFHGGGWLQGDKADCARIISQFLPSGHFAAVAAGYRLTGEAQWPAQLHDSKAAVRWVRANAAKYGLDADHIGVWGASAGGHLALMLGVTGDRPELEGHLGPHTNVSSRVSAVANFLGITDLRALERPIGSADDSAGGSAEERLLGGPASAQKDKAREASPITYVSAKSVPVLTVHGTADPVVPFDQAVRFDAALRKAGGTSYFVAVEGGGHGDFGFVANSRVDAFFDKYLLNKDVTIDTTTITDWKK